MSKMKTRRGAYVAIYFYSGKNCSDFSVRSGIGRDYGLNRQFRRHENIEKQ